MTEDEALALQKVLESERSSFIRYVAESSEAQVRDTFDRRVLAFYEEWARECARSEEAVFAALGERGEAAAVAVASYPLEFSQFNYLSPGYLLRHVISRMSEHRSALEDVATRLEGAKEAHDLVAALIDRQGVFLEQARRLEAERPVSSPKPPRIKGTSASRW